MRMNFAGLPGRQCSHHCRQSPLERDLILAAIFLEFHEMDGFHIQKEAIMSQSMKSVAGWVVLVTIVGVGLGMLPTPATANDARVVVKTAVQTKNEGQAPVQMEQVRWVRPGVAVYGPRGGVYVGPRYAPRYYYPPRYYNRPYYGNGYGYGYGYPANGYGYGYFYPAYSYWYAPYTY